MKKVVIIFIIVIAIFTLRSSPALSNQNEKIEAKHIALIEQTPVMSMTEDNSILQAQCYACHNPKSVTHDEILAPPLEGIKRRYKSLYPDRNTFITRITDLINHPTKENAVVKDPVRRLGLIPPGINKIRLYPSKSDIGYT